MSELSIEIGRMLKRDRERKGISAVQLAERMKFGAYESADQLDDVAQKAMNRLNTQRARVFTAGLETRTIEGSSPTIDTVKRWSEALGFALSTVIRSAEINLEKRAAAARGEAQDAGVDS